MRESPKRGKVQMYESGDSFEERWPNDSEYTGERLERNPPR